MTEGGENIADGDPAPDLRDSPELADLGGNLEAPVLRDNAEAHCTPAEEEDSCFSRHQKT